MCYIKPILYSVSKEGLMKNHRSKEYTHHETMQWVSPSACLMYVHIKDLHTAQQQTSTYEFIRFHMK